MLSQVRKFELVAPGARHLQIFSFEAAFQRIQIALGEEGVDRGLAVLVTDANCCLSGQRKPIAAIREGFHPDEHLPDGFAVAAVLVALVGAAFVLHDGANAPKGFLAAPIAFCDFAMCLSRAVSLIWPTACNALAPAIARP